MATQAFGEAVQSLLTNNLRIGKSVTEMYRVAGVKLVEQGFSGQFGARNERISGMFTDGVDKASAAVINVADMIHARVSRTLAAVAGKVGGVDNRQAKSCLALISKVYLPVVSAASTVNGTLATRIEKLYSAKETVKSRSKANYRRRKSVKR
jgi:hypothetical protein